MHRICRGIVLDTRAIKICFETHGDPGSAFILPNTDSVTPDTLKAAVRSPSLESLCWSNYVSTATNHIQNSNTVHLTHNT